MSYFAFECWILRLKLRDAAEGAKRASIDLQHFTLNQSQIAYKRLETRMDN